MTFWKILIESRGDNWYIMLAACVSVIFAALSVYMARIVKSRFEPNEAKKLKRANYYMLDVFYTIFITLISIFPLLGMLGTVKALLELDMSGDTSELKNNFFQALTSTAWGIIFAVIFKIVNSFIQSYVENQIAKAKEVFKE